MESIELVTKKCSTCSEEKILSDFNKNRRSNDGLQNMCRECGKSYSKVNGKRYREQLQPVGVYTLIIKDLNNISYWYIGSSKNLRDRFSNHKSELKCNRHSNKRLQQIYNEIKGSKGSDYAERALEIKYLLNLDNIFVTARTNQSWRTKPENMAIGIAFHALKSMGLDPKVHILNQTMPTSKKKIDWKVFESKN